MKRHLLPTATLFAALALLLPPSLTAQNDADGKTDAKAEYRGPLPFYFGKLGLDETQKEKLYAIDDDYAGRIEELEKQIQKLMDERDARMETLLTPGQKLRLKELRDAAAKRAEQQAQKEAAIKSAGDKPVPESP